jgi:predicted alpha/beta superfamily hydrolase
MSDWLDYAQYHPDSKHTVAGTLKVLAGLTGPQLADARDILVYLPPSYGDAGRRFPVLYMQDGQNLFDEATSYAGEWQVDETLEQLSREGIEAIVVGVANAVGIGNAPNRRYAEYTPFADDQGEGGEGDRYLAFLVESVKPCVDRAFRSAPGRDQTGIAGSSLGGLISLYAFFRYPQVFGLAGVFSPAFEIGAARFYPFMEQASFRGGKIYMDVGTLEARGLEPDPDVMQELSDLYLYDVRRMRDLLLAKGYREGQDLLYFEEQGGIHHESAWARRLPAALKFLFIR